MTYLGNFPTTPLHYQVRIKHFTEPIRGSQGFDVGWIEQELSCVFEQENSAIVGILLLRRNRVKAPHAGPVEGTFDSFLR